MERGSFAELIRETAVPLVLVAHGLYPGLQPESELTQNIPASASPFILNTLLRGQMGFNGVSITDDMCMGAITQYQSPQDAAFASIRAGMDVLLYKQSSETELEIIEVVTQALAQGDLSMTDHEQSMQRIAIAKASLLPYRCPDTLTEMFNAATLQSAAMAGQSLAVLHGKLPDRLPYSDILLIYPDRRSLPHYAMDIADSPDLPTLLLEQGFTHMQTVPYDIQAEENHYPLALERAIQKGFSNLIWVDYNPQRFQGQLAWVHHALSKRPQARFLRISTGWPAELTDSPTPDAWLGAFGYRPQTMMAIAKRLATVYQDDL
jgi:beta-N-acetylhexosaminidase